MIYLLDVNALVALGFPNHEHRGRVGSWVIAQSFPPLAACSITEPGFVRVLAQAPAYGITVAQARTVLERMKRAADPSFRLIVDDHDASHLPAWVKTGNQTTEGRLTNLAVAAGGIPATLDRKMPGAYLIPEG